MNDVPPKDRDIAMVFQSYALYPHMTVYENMAFALKLRGVPKPPIDEKVQARREDPRHRAPARAQAQGALRRPAAARRASGAPSCASRKCFLFDEPLSNLDAKLRVEMRAEIKRLHMSLNATTIYVTHDQEEAMTLGDRVVVMKDGVVQQCGGALEIYHHPANRFVAGFLGSPPMNFFDGTARERGRPLLLRRGHGQAARAGLGARAARRRAPAGTSCSACVPRRWPTANARFDAGGNTLAMKVTLVQPLGDKMDVYLRPNATRTRRARRRACRDPRRRNAGGLRRHEPRAFLRAGEAGQRIAEDRSLNVLGLKRQEPTS